MYYVTVVVLVAAVVGILVRRDDRPGYGEIADAAPAPLGSRVAGRALAAAGVTVMLALVPVVAVWTVSALAAPGSFSLLDPLLFFGVVASPSLLELCAVVVLAHALLRHAGTGYAVGILCGFVMGTNHQMGVVSYPPAEVGIPPHLALSEFTGWTPWLGYVMTANLFKLAFAVGIVALAWLAWPRGTALTAPLRWRAGLGRAVGGAGALAAATLMLAVGINSVLHEQLVTRGGHRSAEAQAAADAAWESRWWADAAPLRLAGGGVDVVVDPGARRATARWRLDGVRSASGVLHGSLPPGSSDPRATVDGRGAPVTVAFDHFSVPLGACGAHPGAGELDGPDSRAQGCTVELDVEVWGASWSASGETPWLHPVGVWLRAEDLLPTLGHDSDRLLRAPRERREHGLTTSPADVAPAALAPGDPALPGAVSGIGAIIGASARRRFGRDMRMLGDAELLDRIESGEGDRVEFTASTTDLDKFREAICAFANDLPGNEEPGLLFIGLEDDGRCAGSAIDLQLLVTLGGLRTDGKILPFPVMEVARKRLRDCVVAVVQVEPSVNPPVKVDGRCWIRTGPRRDQATTDDERRLTEKRRWGHLPYDMQGVPGATVAADLNMRVFENEYLPCAVSPEVLAENRRDTEDQLRALRLVARDGSPTATAILVLGKDPRDWLPGAYLQFVRYDGTAVTDRILDHAELSGRLPEQLREADALLRLNIPRALDTRGERHVEERGYPYEALREITRNAAIHRNYENSLTPVRISWFADRVEILSPGATFGEVRRDNLGRGVTSYRNPTVAEAMKNLGFMQRFGIGIETARRALAENGNPPPEFDVQDQFVLVTVRSRP